MSHERSSVARVYDRVAPLYDWHEAPMDLLGGRARRRRVIGGATGSILEVGVGTGRNLEFYSADHRLTGIDISRRMLERAARRAAGSNRQVDLRQADVEALPFHDATFDTVTATCVFCSVENPVRGLEEVGRVTKPDGQIRLLEHVRPRNPIVGRLFDWLSPITRRLMGPEINRRTEDNMRAAGLRIESVRRAGIWREIVARPGRQAASSSSSSRTRSM